MLLCARAITAVLDLLGGPDQRSYLIAEPLELAYFIGNRPDEDALHTRPCKLSQLLCEQFRRTDRQPLSEHAFGPMHGWNDPLFQDPIGFVAVVAVLAAVPVVAAAGRALRGNEARRIVGPIALTITILIFAVFGSCLSARATSSFDCGGHDSTPAAVTR